VDYRYVTKDKLTYNFEVDGDLISIVDANHNAITLYRDPTTDRVTSVEDPGGRSLALAYDGNGRLESVTGPDGAEVDYAYDSNGDLTAVDKPENGRTEYTYSKHRLTAVKQRQGDDLGSSAMVTVLTNTLDEVNRVVEQTDAAGKTTEIAYLPGPTRASPGSPTR
jgi:YD repeat-containing protein